MDKKDYYEVLGVPRTASNDDLKKAFRDLAKKFHPDLNPGNKAAEEQFKEINEAFQVLSDPEKRANYDQFGHAAIRPEDVAGFRTASFEDILRTFGFGGDVFGDLFGSRREARPRQREGADIRVDLEITLEQAFSGVKRRVEVPRHSVCPTCQGTGAKPGTLKTCDACGGTGQIRTVQRRGASQRVSVRTCTRCGGSGQLGGEPCETCRGQGRITRTRKITVTIPGGVDDGQYLRIAGEGEPGEQGGPPGDLFVVVHVQEHPTFERYQADLFCRTTIDLATAILGGKVEVPTISGKATLTIPPGTQSHTVFRLKGQGMPLPGADRRGDQLVRVVILIPKRVTEEQRKLISEISPGTKGETTTGFFERRKEQW